MNKKLHKLIIAILVIYLILCYTFIACASQEGIASWYSVASSSNITASGEEFQDEEMTCAMWDVPFNTKFKVTNMENGKSVVCRVNDRGPNRRLNRLIDLSKGAFEKIADLDKGIINVKIERIGK